MVDRLGKKSDQESVDSSQFESILTLSRRQQESADLGGAVGKGEEI